MKMTLSIKKTVGANMRRKQIWTPILIPLILCGAITYAAIYQLSQFKLGIPCTTPEPITWVQGVVINANNGKPILGAMVQVRNPGLQPPECPYLYLTQEATVTNSNGEFRLESVIEQRQLLEITITAQGCETYQQRMEASLFSMGNLGPERKVEFRLVC